MTSLILLVVLAQSPPIPDKSPQPLAAPSKSVPLASPQVQASPQAAYAPEPQAAVVLRAVPQIYAIQRQVVLAAPVYATATVAYDAGCAVQQQTVIQHQVVQRAVVNHGVVHQAQVNHGLVGGVGRAARGPKKIVTKQITKTKRGLLGGLFGG